MILSSCAKAYKIPSGNDVARLRVNVPETARNAAVNVNIYPSGKCEEPMELAYLGGSLNMSDLEPIGIPGSRELEKDTFFERIIEANNKALFSIRLVVPQGRCYVSFSMVPETNVDYETKVTWNWETCTVSLNKVAETPSGYPYYKPVKTFLREETCIKGFY